MTVTRFFRAQGLIVVDARIYGIRGAQSVSLAVDTGAMDTVVTPELIDELGYSPRDGERVTTVRTALGKEHGYSLRVKRFAALGFAVPDCRIHVFDLATGDDIDGLLGLSFLDAFDYHVRSEEGRILVERATNAA